MFGRFPNTSLRISDKNIPFYGLNPDRYEIPQAWLGFYQTYRLYILIY